MATRQYIGARYVPKFYQNSVDGSTAWEANVVYEPLIYVTLQNGHMYISKKQVPATVGTPASNVDYWLDIGSYNGFINELQGEIDDINSELTDVIADVNSVLNVKRDKLIVVGNSYVDRGCAAKIETLFNSYNHFTQGGIGFVQYAGHTSTFENMVDNAIADTTIDKSKVTDVLFVSAMGDTRACQEGNYTTALLATLSSIKTKLEANFPNLKNVMVTLAETRNVTNFNDNYYKQLFTVHKLFKEICPLYGMWYLGWSGFNSLFVNDDIDSDHYHPTATGASKIGTFIKNAYEGHVEYLTKTSTNTGQSCGLSNASTVTLVTHLTPDTSRLEVRRSLSNIGDAVVLAVGASYCATDLCAIPLPRPTVDIDICSPLIHALNGTAEDFFPVTITGGTAGIAYVKCNGTPTMTTIPTSYMVIPELCSVSWDN